MAKASCKIDGCAKPVIARGWCGMHYRRWRLNGDPLLSRKRVRIEKACSVDGCDKPWDARGLCNTHWKRWRKHGDPLKGAAKNDGRSTNSDGYILLYRPGHPMAAPNGQILEHRVVMSEVLGRILASSEVVHHKNGNKADNRLENLELMDWAEHSRLHNSGPRKVSKTAHQEITDLAMAGWRHHDIGAAYGISRSAVSLIAKQARGVLPSQQAAELRVRETAAGF